MNKMLGCLVVAGAMMAAGLSGCTDPIAASQDPIQVYPQVQVDSYWMASWARVGTPVPMRVGAGQLEVAIPIRNLNDYDLQVEFQYRFKNKAGVLIEEPGRGSVRVPRKDQAEIRFTSMTPLAEDFQVTLRYIKMEG